MIDEGYTKYQCDWRIGPCLSVDVIAHLNQCRNRLHQAGLVGHYAADDVGYGNVSVRAAGSGAFIISGTQTGHIACTNEQHFSLVTGYDIDANRLSCTGPVQASSEALTHAAIYELDAAIGAVVHVHSAPLWQALQGIMPTTDAGVAYGTPAMAHEFKRLYQQTDLPSLRIAVMAGHPEGIVTFGSSIDAATDRVLELAAKV
jgi:ribulose-5-phosphate 4-epimerase/fuculose-1-phosphate aldolase